MISFLSLPALSNVRGCLCGEKVDLQIDRRLPDFSNRCQRIASPHLFGNPFLFRADDVEQQLPVLGRWHIVLQLLLIRPIIEWLAALRVKLFPRAPPNSAMALV